MNRSRIEWTNYTTNPVRGLCPVGCSYCYARAMYHRFKWDGTIRYDESAWKGLEKIPAGSRVFVGSTIDLFHKETVGFFPQIMERVNSRPDVTFIFLTKCPQNLPKEWPDNCWVGISVNSNQHAYDGHYSNIMESVRASVRFISAEPLLGRLQGAIPVWCNWVIIGQQTPSKPATMPNLEWIEEIVQACNTSVIPVFLKNNLKPFLDSVPTRLVYQYGSARLRQELPK